MKSAPRAKGEHTSVFFHPSLIMPKQTSSLNISYEPIPDKDESLAANRYPTPHNSSARQPFLDRGTRKLITIVIGLFILIGVAFSYFMSQRDAYFQNVIDERDRHSVGVYQTSDTYYLEDRLSDMRPEDFQARGVPLSSWSFDFTPDTELSPCGGIDSMADLVLNGGLCSSGLDPDVPQAVININTSKTYQEVIGFGGAFTEAAAHNFFQLSADAQTMFLEAYFGPEGIAYTLGRIHINSCDFSLSSYNFDDVKDDFEMKYFDRSVAHDQKEIIPLLLAAMTTSSSPLQLIAAPWSPPGWMKVQLPTEEVTVNASSDSTPSADHVNEQSLPMVGSSSPNGLMASPDIMAAWALYISTFISSYSSLGVPIWAVTPQNEPEFIAPWEACAYNSSFERAFIDGYLGPQLKKAHPEIKILAFDHNKDHLVNWTKAMMIESKIMSPYVDGMAFHWYAATGDRLLDGTYGYDAVADAHFVMNGGDSGRSSGSNSNSSIKTDTYLQLTESSKSVNSSFEVKGKSNDEVSPDAPQHRTLNKILLATEGCNCPGVRLNSWFRAQRIGHDIMYDLSNYAQGWIDWNLLVDHTGGPNHLGNLCDAPVVASADFNRIHLQPEYFVIGHFSKFIPPKSVRVDSRVVGNFNFQTSVHPDVHEGIELGVFPCERSSRQMWKWRVSPKHPSFGYLQLLVSALTDEDTSGSDSVNSKEVPADANADADADSSGHERKRKRLLRESTNAGTDKDSSSSRSSSSDNTVFRCMGKGDNNRPFLRLWDCFPPAMDTDEKQEEGPPGTIDSDSSDLSAAAILRDRRLSLRMEKVHVTAHEDIVRLIEEPSTPEESVHRKSTGGRTSPLFCVSMSPHARGLSDSPSNVQPGTLLNLQKCDSTLLPDDKEVEDVIVPIRDVAKNKKLLRQLWKWDKSTGEMTPLSSILSAVDLFDTKKKGSTHFKQKLSPHTDSYCITAGWPYLSSVAFLSPNQQTIVTVINEYPTDTYVLLKDKNRGSMWTALNGKSIQTITF